MKDQILKHLNRLPLYAAVVLAIFGQTGPAAFLLLYQIAINTTD